MPSDLDREWVRVRVVATKTHITVPREAFDSSTMVELKQDPLDRNGNPRGPKYPNQPLSSATPDNGGEATQAENTQATERGQK